MRAAIAIDAWKLEIFERHLTEALYQYRKGPGLSSNMLILKVDTDDVRALEKVVRAANTEAARTRTH